MTGFMTEPRRPHPTRPGPRPRRGVLAVVGAAGIILSACSAGTVHHHRSSAPPTSTRTTAADSPKCPLTGTPVPGGGPVPSRPALAVKIDNYVAARPQSGMDKADIIFEEPVEGGITRYAAVFQCQNAALVGPVRSARNIDIGILGQLGAPLLVHVGGINPVLANINASPLVNIDLGYNGSLQTHPAGRVAPYDTYSSTAQLWSTRPAMTTPPQPLFSYSSQVPAGTPVSTVHIDFSVNSDVTWKYEPSGGVFARYYNGTEPDVLANGVQNTAANVIVQYVQVYYGPWLENSEGGLEVQANLYSGASGTAEVFRDGVEIAGTWHRSALGSPTQFVTTAGTPIPLKPGQTWVELVPSTVTVTTTP
jgi:hypothetical protein